MSAVRVLSLGFGLLMVAGVVPQADGPGLAAAAMAGCAVLASARWARAATVAVMAAVVGLAVSDPAPALVVFAGAAACCYLVVRHAGGAGLGTPTLIALSAGSLVGLGLAALPSGLPWLPLLAPLAVLVAFVAAAWPLAGGARVTPDEQLDRKGDGSRASR